MRAPKARAQFLKAFTFISFLHCVDSYRIHIRTSGRTVSRIWQGFTIIEIRWRLTPKSCSPDRRVSPRISITKVMPQSIFFVFFLFFFFFVVFIYWLDQLWLDQNLFVLKCLNDSRGWYLINDCILTESERRRYHTRPCDCLGASLLPTFTLITNNALVNESIYIYTQLNMDTFNCL